MATINSSTPYNDLIAGLGSTTLSEIRRKAEAGIAMDSPTAAKEELYRRAQADVTKHIIQKAQTGVAMDTTNPWKQSIYDQYSTQKAQPTPVATAPEVKAPVAQLPENNTSYIEEIYNKQKEAQLAQLYASRDAAIGKLGQQKTETAASAQANRNQADVVNAQNVQKLRELMASSGISASGENVTASANLANARQNALNSINSQESSTYADINRQISDLNNPANENALVAAIEAQRSQALYNANRDSISDSQWKQNFDAQASQWAQQFNAQNSQWAQQFNAQNSQWAQQYNNSNNQWQQEFNQSANQFNQSLAFQKQQFNSEQEWQKYTFNNMSATEKAQLENNKMQFGEEMAWKLYETQYQAKVSTANNQALINFYNSGKI